MKIQLKSIATALIIAGVCICSAKPSMAQKTVSQQTAVNTRLSPHERNTKLIGDFQKMTDEKAAFSLLKPIKNGLNEELAASKREILTAHQSNNEQAVEKAEQSYKKLVDIYNTVMQKSRTIDSFDKNAIDKAFSEYLKL